MPQIRQRKEERIVELQRNVIAYLKTHPCVDCGEPDVVVLEFDHVRGQKSGRLATMIANGGSWAKIEEEIAKCDVRCANCHRRKTAKQLRFYKTLWGVV